MPLGSSHRVLAGVAAAVTAACVVLGGGTAFASKAPSRVRGHEWWLRRLHVTRAWRISRGSGITVAVLSTGVDASQADLTGSVITGPDYTGSGRTPGGAYRGAEGTALASLIAGHGHGPGRADGIMGVAPAARILSVRVTLESDDPLLAEPAVARRLPAAIARGIRYAVAHGARVIDLPLDPVTTPGAAGAGGSAAERSAVAYALARGAVLVAPAGDGGAGADPVNYPAAYRGVISVGAFNAKFVKAPFSSRRPYVTLTAAGQGVVADAVPHGYTKLHSTAAASAIVAGMAALIRARFPALTPRQVRRALIRSTVFQPPGGRSDGSGYGTADAAQALAAAARIAGPAATPRVSATPGHPVAGRAVARQTPAVPGSPIGTLLAGAVIAVAVLAALALAVLGAGRLQRRRARAARLAGVRAAAEIPPRRSRDGRTAPQPVVPPAVVPPAVAPRAVVPDAFLPAPPPGAAAPGGPQSGSGLPGSALPGSAFRGGALPGSAFRGGAHARSGPGPAPGGGPGRAQEPAGGPGLSLSGAEGTGGAEAGRVPAPHRMGVIRRPTVSGSPPWGPAPRPGGEPPSAGQPEPAPADGSALPRRVPRAQATSVWDSLAEEAWPGGPQRYADQRGSRLPGESPGTPGSPEIPDWPATPGTPDWPATPGSGTRNWPGRTEPDSGWPREPDGTAGRPGAHPPGGAAPAWNPGAATEAFPAADHAGASPSAAADAPTSGDRDLP